MWSTQAETRWIIAAIVLALALFATPGRADTQQAKQILDATGIKGGLIVHIGCGNSKLISALRANDSYTVHGLDSKQENVAATRRYIKSLEQSEAFQGNRGALLVAVSRDSGEKLAAYSLDFVPRFDGLIAANGQLYMSSLSGEILCLSNTQGRPLSPAEQVVIAARE